MNSTQDCGRCFWGRCQTRVTCERVMVVHMSAPLIVAYGDGAAHR